MNRYYMGCNKSSEAGTVTGLAAFIIAGLLGTLELYIDEKMISLLLIVRMNQVAC